MATTIRKEAPSTGNQNKHRHFSSKQTVSMFLCETEEGLKGIWVFVFILSDISIDLLVFDSDFTRQLSLFRFKVHYAIHAQQTSAPIGREKIHNETV